MSNHIYIEKPDFYKDKWVQSKWVCSECKIEKVIYNDTYCSSIYFEYEYDCYISLGIIDPGCNETIIKNILK